MIIPTKHTNFSESLLGFGSYILNTLASPQSIDELWAQYQDDYKNKKYFGKQDFNTLVLTVLFLYSIEAVIEKNGMLEKCA